MISTVAFFSLPGESRRRRRDDRGAAERAFGEADRVGGAVLEAAAACLAAVGVQRGQRGERHGCTAQRGVGRPRRRWSPSDGGRSQARGVGRCRRWLCWPSVGCVCCALCAFNYLDLPSLFLSHPRTVMPIVTFRTLDLYIRTLNVSHGRVTLAEFDTAVSCFILLHFSLLYFGIFCNLCFLWCIYFVRFTYTLFTYLFIVACFLSYI